MSHYVKLEKTDLVSSLRERKCE